LLVTILADIVRFIVFYFIPSGSSYFCTLTFFFTASEWKIVFGLFTKMLLIPQIVSLFESNLGRHLCPLLITQTEIMLDSQREEKSKTKQKHLSQLFCPPMFYGPFFVLYNKISKLVRMVTNKFFYMF
jgi:hypothetical protein